MHLKYTILHGDDIGKLTVSVNDFISQGWKPVGGVATASVGVGGAYGTDYYQSMVKEDAPHE